MSNCSPQGAQATMGWLNHLKILLGIYTSKSRFRELHGNTSAGDILRTEHKYYKIVVRKCKTK